MLASILSSDADVKGLLQFSSNICIDTFATNKEQLAIYWPWQDPGPLYDHVKQYIDILTNTYSKPDQKKSFHNDYMLKSTVDFLSKFKRLVRASCDICNCQTAWVHHTMYLSESWKSYSPNQWKFFQKPRILQTLVVYLLLSNSGNFDQNGKENFVLTSQKISERNRSSWKVVQNF